MSEQDAERARKLYHALKCAETYHAMKDAGDWEDPEGEEGYSGEGRSVRRGRSYGGSYRRGRDMRTGRYISRGMDEYGYSGHYPMDYIAPMWDRRY